MRVLCQALSTQIFTVNAFPPSVRCSIQAHADLARPESSTSAGVGAAPLTPETVYTLASALGMEEGWKLIMVPSSESIQRQPAPN